MRRVHRSTWAMALMSGLHITLHVDYKSTQISLKSYNQIRSSQHKQHEKCHKCKLYKNKQQRFNQSL